MPVEAKKPIENVVATGAVSPVDFLNFSKRVWLGAVILFLFTALLYAPSYRAGFIWDDKLLLENLLVNGGWAGLRDLWMTTKFPDFCPLTATSFWLEAQLGGATPTVRHATNIFLQGLNVVLVWLVLRRLKIPGAWIAAALFAAHPLAVTSVTWVAERKNTLSMFFYLLSFWFYLRSTEPENAEAAGRKKRSRFYWFSFLFFIFALLSKTATVVLPVVILLCAWWQNGRIQRDDLRRTAPFFGIALAGGMATLAAHYFFGPPDVTADPLLARMLSAGRAVWFYLGKAVWPMNLTMHYPRWEMAAGEIISYVPLLGMAGLMGVCWRFRESWGRAGLFGFGYFLVALGPTLGVAKMTFLKFSQVADHFQYLALPGLMALVVGSVFHLARGKRALHLSQGILLLGVLPVLAVLSWQHQRIVGHAESLWRDNVQKNPQSWLALNCLADALQARGQWEEAEAHYRRAIAMRPDYLDALSNLGVLLGRTERWPEAVETHRRAVAFNPRVAALQFNLGTALFSQGKFSEAIEPLARAMELAPANSAYRNNLASALMQAGKIDEAWPQLREAVRLDPANAEAQTNLGLILSRQGKNREALEQYQAAIQLEPGNISARHYLGLLLAAQGKNEQAYVQFAEMARHQPDSLLAQTDLAEALTRQGKISEAVGHRAAAHFLRGRDALNRNRVNEAKDLFRQALALDAAGTVEFAGRVSGPATPNALAHLDLLAATCAETKRFADTANALRKVISLAAAVGRPDAVLESRRRLEHYQKILTTDERD